MNYKFGSSALRLSWKFWCYLLVGSVLFVMAFMVRSAKAAAGINQEINFQGRLLNSQGAVVPDGYYNIEFKIYQDGDGQSAGDTTGTPAGTLVWTEDYLNSNSQGVQVVNGFLSVQLGSICALSGGSCQGNTNAGVNWNSDTLWLSMNVAGTNTTCTPFSSCSPDGEMLPMKRMSSTPYSLNSQLVGGLSTSQLVQLGQSEQTDSTTGASIYINKTGASGNLIDLQSGGNDAFLVSHSGDLTFGSNADHTISIASAAAGVAGNNLSFLAGAAGSGATALAGGNVIVQAGAGGGTNGNGGNISIDAGAKNGTGSDGTVNIGTNHASAINIGTASTPTNLNGSLVFKNGSSGVTLNNTGTSNYTLTLPSAGPAAGLCLETSPADRSQLVFASCTNNNASIQEVHEWDANNINTVTISPTTIGDEIVLTTQIPTSGVTVSSISGGGVTTWNKVVTSAGDGTVNRVEMWVGTVMATGSSTITVTYSSSPGAEEITATEFTAAGVNSSTSWGIESSASQLNSTASTTVTFPSATAVDGSELYVGYAQVQNPPATSGGTTSFNYIITSTQHNVITYDPSLTANTSYQPVANQNSAGESNAVEAVLTAFVTSTSINNTTSLQKANFNVQAATSGSVAGILQAASSGSADILDLRNSSATNIASFGNTGNITFQNSTNSPTAFQVKNQSGNSLLTVNTSTNQVSLGTAAASAGVLSFNDATDSNAISLSAPSSIAASYTLSLPTNTPTAGLCLGTSPTNANQLIFASCATQVSAAGISYVNNWSSNGSSITTLADSPSNKGNLLILYSHTTNNVTISSISGGGAGSWTKINAYSGGGTPGNIEMWRGVVNTVGAGTITVTYSGAAGTNEIDAQEFTMGSSSGTWAVDTSGTSTSTTSVTTINYPSLTAQNSSELYTGYAYGQNAMSAGTTSGFTYLATSASKYLAYDTNVTGGIAYQPTATQSTAGVYASVGAMIEAYSGTSVIVDTTATQEANFNVQAATDGTVAGILQAAAGGTADIMDLRDSTGNNIVAVNASNGMTLGTSNVVAGQLNFEAIGNTNTISVVAPSTPGSSYALTLPTTTPAAGECLATSPNNANQLVFSSCANQVTSIAISYVNSWKANGNAITTLNVSPTNIGDLMVLFSSPNSSSTIAGITGGGVTTWTKVTGNATGSGSGTSSIEMWRGIITSTGASTITVNFNKSTGNPSELAAMEFTTGSASGSWVVDASNAQYNTASTTLDYPSLTPQSTKDLYVGYAASGSTISAGTTSGFTYVPGSLSTREGLYDNSVSSTVQPTANLSTSSSSIAVGALIAAYSSSSVISNSTVTQEGNFNVQAATNGSVAGVLQAAAGGSGDVLDILNAAGTLTDGFGSTGNLLVEPSTASAAALQVQTTGAVNVLSVDTNNKLVVIGAGSAGESSPSLLVLDNESGTTADPSVLNGAMYYNATTRSFRCGVAGAWQNCNSLLYANTSTSSAVSNCTNNCAAFSTTTAIPANYCQAGRVIKLYADGYFSSLSTASNLQFGIYYGTDSNIAANDTLLGTLSPAASVTSASNNYFQINFNISCFSTTTMQSGGTLQIQTGSSSAGMLTLPMGSNSGSTVVSSTTKNLYIFPIWDTASASNTAAISQFTVNAF